MSPNRFFGAVLILLGGVGCTFDSQNPPLEILEETPLSEMSLPSAVVSCEGADYLACRDASFISVFSQDTLRSVFPLNNCFIDPEKPYLDPGQRLDLAAGAEVHFSGKPFLTFLSSGNNTDQPFRDTVYLADPTSEEVLYRKNVRELYDEMIRDAGLDEINIEGAALSGSSLFLFHGSEGTGNIIFQFPREAFYRYLTGMTDITPAFEFLEVSLPAIEGNLPVFSDALYLSQENALLFSAKLLSPKDGSPSGCCLGMIPLYDPEKITMAAFRGAEGLMPFSIEAIALQSRTQDGLVIKAYGNDLEGKTAKLWRFLYRPFPDTAKK